MIRPHSQSSCTSIGYRVEVRDELFGYGGDMHGAIKIEDGIVTDKWREVVTRRYPHSSPTFAAIITLPQSRCKEAALNDLLPYATAAALAKWLVALHPLTQLQCRIVSYKLEWTSSLFRQGLVDEPLILTEVAPVNIVNGLEPKFIPEEESK